MFFGLPALAYTRSVPLLSYFDLENPVALSNLLYEAFVPHVLLSLEPLSFYFSSSGFLTPLGSRTVFCLLCFLLGWLPDALNVRNGWAHSLLSPLFYLWLPVDSGVRQKLSKSWIVSAHRAWTPITLPPAWPCQPSYPRAPWCSSFISEWRSDEQVG